MIHGSRDPRPALAVSDLAQLFAERIRHQPHSGETAVALVDLGQERSIPAVLTPPEILVGTASLECHPLRLHEQILEFWRSRSQDSQGRLVILPLFLLPGVHVMQDIPEEIALAQAALGRSVEIQTRPHLGSHPGLRRLLNERTANQPLEAWILLAHGSRRPGANQPIAALADHLGAVSAYWSVSPNLETQVQELSQQGLTRIGILPYFLFPGGITDAIARSVATLVDQHPELHLHLAEPLQASSELADLLLDLAQDQNVN